VPDDITAYRVDVPEAALIDLRDRLRRTRWPEAETVEGWTQGVPLAYLQDLCRYWAEQYDWRAAESRLNAVPQYRSEVDGLRIHFLHRRSPHPGALPLVLTHGWPGSVLEFLEVVGPLTDPVAHGGAATDAWAALMARLGYDRYGAAGSDWGTSISSVLGQRHAGHLAGIHLVPPLAAPDPTTLGDLTGAERAALADLRQRSERESAYSEQHRTKPQTIGYALLDSPAGLCAWIVEKLWTWTDHDTAVDAALTREQVLDTVTLYWVTGTGASSARLYWESIERVSRWMADPVPDVVGVPTGCSIFPAEVPRPSRRWAARRYPDIRYWREHDRGGHFAAVEAPELLIADLRAFFRLVR